MLIPVHCTVYTYRNYSVRISLDVARKRLHDLILKWFYLTGHYNWMYYTVYWF